MFFEDNWDDVTAKLPTWAHPPRGKGVTQTLRSAIISELAAQKIVHPDLRVKQLRSYQALVLALIERDHSRAEAIVSKVLSDYRRKHSKRYSLD